MQNESIHQTKHYFIIISVSFILGIIAHIFITQSYARVEPVSNFNEYNKPIKDTKTAEVISGGAVLTEGHISGGDKPTKETNQGGTKPVLEATITHRGFSTGSIVQEMIQYAWDVGGYNLVALIECENGGWNPKQQSNVVVNGHREQSFGLCQVMSNNAIMPENWKEQIDLCWKLRQEGTPFYGPTRKIKGVACYKYVSDRFITILK